MQPTSNLTGADTVVEATSGRSIPQLALVLGGAKSGKSDFAVQLAASRGERVLFVATATAGDAEMAARIEAHRRARPATWTTIEAPTGVGSALRPLVAEGETVLLDCLSLLVANCLMDSTDSPSRTRESPRGEIAVDDATTGVTNEVSDLLAVAQEARCHLIVVSSEVGFGIVPEYPLGRRYRDLLGSANQQVAKAADEVYLVLAGIPVELKRIASVLGGGGQPLSSAEC